MSPRIPSKLGFSEATVGLVAVALAVILLTCTAVGFVLYLILKLAVKIIGIGVE